MKIKRIERMEFQLQVLNPFIICFHHKDRFPKGNKEMGPIHSLNKNKGEDFDLKADWRMYYGTTVPGFPVHPHRGFETITVVMEGFADHFDSLGSKGRYGEGDVQWMTAGAGIQHSEMFPILKEDEDNILELFQIWLNLPAKNKFAKADYKMFWDEDIPIAKYKDINGRNTAIKVIAGKYNDVKSLDPLPASWAYDRTNKVNIWLIEMEAEAEFTLPKVSPTIGRMLYYYDGKSAQLETSTISKMQFAELDGDQDILIKNNKEKSRFLLMEGNPIEEPIAAQGPFVMNTVGELKKAFSDYHETEFGGWQWDRKDPVNPREQTRFASYNNDERVDIPKG